jgi:hypothetical protein
MTCRQLILDSGTQKVPLVLDGVKIAEVPVAKLMPKA